MISSLGQIAILWLRFFIVTIFVRNFRDADFNSAHYRTSFWKKYSVYVPNNASFSAYYLLTHILLKKILGTPTYIGCLIMTCTKTKDILVNKSRCRSSGDGFYSEIEIEKSSTMIFIINNILFSGKFFLNYRQNFSKNSVFSTI